MDILIISGSRHLNSIKLVDEAIQASGFKFDIVIQGGAGGIDTAAFQWCLQNQVWCIDCRVEPWAWTQYGKKAGPMRNGIMGALGTMLIAIPCPQSKGTWDMVGQAKHLGLPTYVHRAALDVKGEKETNQVALPLGKIAPPTGKKSS